MSDRITKNLKNVLTVIVAEEGGQTVAGILDYDLFTQGNSLSDALHSLAECVTAFEAWAAAEDAAPFAHCRRSPQEYWDLIGKGG